MPQKPYSPPKTSGHVPSKPNTNGRPSFRQLSDDAPTWDNVPSELISAIVCMCTTQGASPTFGYTRNGRSLTLAVWWKGERDIQYLTSPGEVGEYALFLAREWFRLSDEEVSEYALSLTVVA